MENEFLLVTPAPHAKCVTTTQNIMRDVLIALVPAGIMSIFNFGIESLFLILVCVAGCVGTEYILQVTTKKTITIGDLSAAVTGVLLAYNMPVTMPYWIAIIGCIFSILVVKFIFGGLGKNIVNPALAGRAFLLAAYPVAMTNFVIDGVSGATPLANIKLHKAASAFPSISDLLLGQHKGGCIGEISVIAILIGAAYLFIRKVITWHVPVAYLGTSAILILILNRNPSINSLSELLMGGLLLGVFFMATDYTTTPITKKGQIIFGVGCGIITILIRTGGSYAEGVSYSILLMNICVPFIDRLTKNKVFGVGGERK